MVWENYLELTKSILVKMGYNIDSKQKDEMLWDALADSLLLWIERKLVFKNEYLFRKWICKTTAFKYIEYYKFYKKYEFYDKQTFEELFADQYCSNELEVKEYDIFEIVKKYCNDIDYQIIIKFYVEGYTLKEIAKDLNLNYETVYKRHQRLLEKLKNILPPPPKINYFYFLKIICPIRSSKSHIYYIDKF